VVVALVVLALLALTLFRRKPAAAVFHSDGEIRAEVERYRAAIKARTLCDRCLSANPAKSNYCAECGTAL
jgi:hypothetical protein